MRPQPPRLLSLLIPLLLTNTHAEKRFQEPSELRCMQPPLDISIANRSDEEPDLLWEWEGEPRWLTGVNWGGDVFFGSSARGRDVFGSTLDDDGHVEIEIRFDERDTTYAQVYRRDKDYAAEGVGVFRGSAWDISDEENARRLNVCLVEWDDGSSDSQPNLLWDPDDSSVGKREYLFVMDSDYDGTGASYNDQNSGIEADVQYFLWLKIRSGYSLYETDTSTLRFRFAHIRKLTALPNDSQIGLSWEFDKPDAESLLLYHGTDPLPESVLDTLSVSQRSYLHTGLVNGQEYYYRLEAIDSEGEMLYKSRVIRAKPQMVTQNMEHIDNWNDRSQYGDIWGYTEKIYGKKMIDKEYALICVRNEGLSIIDISGEVAREVSFVPSIAPDMDSKDVKVFDHYAVLCQEYEPAQVIDLTDPSKPVTVSTIHFGSDDSDGGAHNLYIDGEYLYVVGHDAGGVQIFDLSDPTAPKLVGHFDTYYYHDIYVRHDTAYAAAIYGDGIDVLDVSDKRNPKLLTTFNYPNSGAHNCWTTEDGDYLFVGDEIGAGQWTRIFDVSDLSNVEQVARYVVDEEATVHNLYVKGDLMYVAHYTEGVRVVDVSDPKKPREIAFYDTYLPQEYGYSGAWSVYPYFGSGKIIASDMQSGLFVMKLAPEALKIDVGRKVSLPATVSLSQNYPNPFNSKTRIDYRVPSETVVWLEILDILGRRVRLLTEVEHAAGDYQTSWDGRNDLGQEAHSGIYLLRLRSSSESVITRIVLIR